MRYLINYIKNKIKFRILFRNKLFSNYTFFEEKKLPRLIFLNKSTTLCNIMRKNGSDKGSYIGTGRHNYTPIYFQLFKTKRNDGISLFELGIGTTNLQINSNMGLNGTPGASLNGWSEFFINGKIYGADIDKSILFNTKKIKTFYCDQTNMLSINDLWNKNPDLDKEFDIIIDDGLHEFAANKLFFESSIHKLKVRGIYIIEDIVFEEINNWKRYLKTFDYKYPFLRYTLLIIPNKKNIFDNNLLIVEKIF